MKQRSGLILILTLAMVVGCETVPITGRRQLSFVPQGQLMGLSRDNYEQILKESKLSQDPDQVEMVRRVGDRLVQAVTQYMGDTGQSGRIKDYAWEFNLIEDDKTMNAFCLPGGKVAVYTGLLRVTQDDAGLAAVISHEIAHAIANHGGERMSQMLLVELGGYSLSQALKQSPAKTQTIWMSAYGVGTTVGVVLPYSRSHENEADRIGLIIMALGGYDPNAAIGLWERMNQEQKQGKLPDFLSTHPAPATRIKLIRDHIQEAMGYYKS